MASRIRVNVPSRPCAVIFALLLSASVLPTCVRAQGGGGGAGSTGLPVGGPLTGVEGPIISESYILMPGDQVLATITGSVTYSYFAWITYEGKFLVEIPLNVSEPGGLQIVDAVRISGMNMKSAQDSLSRVFERYFKSATVKLTLTNLRSGVVFVTGEVQSPGAVYASPVERVSQVIAKAGGLTPLGSKTRIEVIRENRVAKKVNIEKFESNGDLSANPFVESGDRVYVPAVSGIITVKGAVFGRGDYRLRTSALTTEKERISEGMYELIPGDRVMDLVKKAGGITPWADLKTSYVTRRSQSGDDQVRIPVDLTSVLFKSDPTGNILLQNDDVLVIPPINTLVYVEGEVNKPAAYLYTPNLKFNDYVGMAGGPNGNANLSISAIFRNGRKLPTRANPLVEPGDIVMVPRVAFKWWQDYLQIFSSVGMPIAVGLLSFLSSTR